MNRLLYRLGLRKYPESYKQKFEELTELYIKQGVVLKQAEKEIVFLNESKSGNSPVMSTESQPSTTKKTRRRRKTTK